MKSSEFILRSALMLAALAPLVAAQTSQPAPAAAAATAAVQAPVPMHVLQKEFMVPVPKAFPGGLDAIEMYFTTPGRHPLVVLTHGTAPDAEQRAHVTPWGFESQALWFARRGYVVIGVVRSGYGRSGGKQDSTNGGCTPGRGSFDEAGTASADDLRAVIKIAQSLPEVDPNTVVSAGVSTGGFAQVALAANPPPGLKAAINFAGGRGGDGHENNCNLSGVVDAFRIFGKAAHQHGDLPMLWIYSENDHWFPPTMAQQFDAAFTKAGGVNRFVMAPPDGTDGHHLFGHVSAWSDTVQAFLKAQNLLPLGDLVLPEPEPPNLPMPAGLKDTDAAEWHRFLMAPPLKTLVIDESGKLWISGAGFNQALADEAAKDHCKKGGGKSCTIVARTPGGK